MKFINDLDRFSNVLSDRIENYFNQDGQANILPVTMKLDGMNCAALTELYANLQKEHEVALASIDPNVQYITWPGAPTKAKMDEVLSKMVNMNCPVSGYSQVVRPTQSTTLPVSNKPCVGCQPEQEKSTGIPAVIKSGNAGGSPNMILGVEHKSSGGVIESTINFVSDVFNGILCGLGLSKSAACKVNSIFGSTKDADYSNASGCAGDRVWDSRSQTWSSKCRDKDGYPNKKQLHKKEKMLMLITDGNPSSPSSGFSNIGGSQLFDNAFGDVKGFPYKSGREWSQVQNRIDANK